MFAMRKPGISENYPCLAKFVAIHPCGIWVQLHLATKVSFKFALSALLVLFPVDANLYSILLSPISGLHVKIYLEFVRTCKVQGHETLLNAAYLQPRSYFVQSNSIPTH